MPEPGNLPRSGRRQLLRVYQECLKEGQYSKARCSKIAWASVKNAGWHKKDGKWVKTESSEANAETAQFWSSFDKQWDDAFNKERREHPDLPDQTIEQIVNDHLYGEDEQPKDVDKLEKVFDATTAKTANRFTVPTFYTSFKAAPLDAVSGKIGLLGTYLDYLGTTNGWHVDPAEEPHIVEALNSGRMGLRLAHSKEPDRTIGKYTKGVPRPDNSQCPPDHPEGPHIDFEAEAIPADPQIRVNIANGYISDISPGMDAEVYCEECAEPWGVDKDTGMLIKSCEHKDAEGVLRNVIPKEGSIVVEPAFEGRTPFRPTFAAAMNALFSNSLANHSSSPAGAVATRVSPDRDGSRQAMTANTIKEGDSIMVESKDKTVGESSKEDSNAELRRIIAEELKKVQPVTAESKDKGKAPPVDQDEEPLTADAFRAALKVLKAAMKMSDEARKALGVGESEAEASAATAAKAESEGEGKFKKAAKAKGESEGESEDEDESKCAQKTTASVVGAKVPSADPTLAEKTGKKAVAGIYATVNMADVKQSFEAASKEVFKEVQNRMRTGQ